jgi:hypothetical protein
MRAELIDRIKTRVSCLGQFRPSSKRSVCVATCAHWVFRIVCGHSSAPPACRNRLWAFECPNCFPRIDSKHSNALTRFFRIISRHSNATARFSKIKSGHSNALTRLFRIISRHLSTLPGSSRSIGGIGVAQQGAPLTHWHERAVVRFGLRLIDIHYANMIAHLELAVRVPCFGPTSK